MDNEVKKLDMESLDIVDENIEKIRNLFPNCITETEDGVKIDYDMLKQELSKDIVEENKEKYQLTWPGKKECIIEANKSINKTLRPVIDKSVNFNNTKNIYIEGDNLEVLKILQESYLNKIKMIYIDPPYNTGRDFIYSDKFDKMSQEELFESGQITEENNKLVANNDSNGRFHSDWLSMIYPRIKLSRHLLQDNGVIFISIGQEEINNLINICDEIFGERNRVGQISRIMKSGGNQGRQFSKNIDYILVYAKNISSLEDFREPLEQDLIDKIYTSVEKEGKRKGEKYRTMGLYQAGLEERINQRFWIRCPDGSLAIPEGKTFPKEKEEGKKVIPQQGEGVWRWTYERYVEEFKKGNIEFKKTNTSSLVDENGNQSKYNIYTKIWLNDRLDEGRIPVDIITKYENRQSSKELKELDIPFDFAKPSELIRKLIGYLDLKDTDIIMDYFSGSASTAHAVLVNNAEYNRRNKFIMIQLPELCDEQSQAYKQGYRTICDIGKERIKRAAKKIKEEKNANIDYGFRVYKVDSSNMKDVYYAPTDLRQNQLNMLESNIKEDRTAEDLLTQVILDLGLTLDLKIEERKILNNNLYFVESNSLVACFDETIDINIIDEICKCNPLKIVFKESSFKTDSDKINTFERIKKLSPETEINII